MNVSAEEALDHERGTDQVTEWITNYLYEPAWNSKIVYSEDVGKGW
jgi:hypothetical protein